MMHAIKRSCCRRCHLTSEQVLNWVTYLSSLHDPWYVFCLQPNHFYSLTSNLDVGVSNELLLHPGIADPVGVLGSSEFEGIGALYWPPKHLC